MILSAGIPAAFASPSAPPDAGLSASSAGQPSATAPTSTTTAPTSTSTAPTSTTTTPPVVNLNPVLSKVQGDLYQLTAIADFQPAQALVTKARRVVSVAETQLGAAASALADARVEQGTSQLAQAAAASKLRAIALGAYIGEASPSASPAVGPTTSGAGAGTGAAQRALAAIDAQEMLVIVGQQAQAHYRAAVGYASQSAARVAAAQRSYESALAVSKRDKVQLDSALRTLTLVENAATSPPSASSPALPVLPGQSTAAKSNTTTTEPILAHSPASRPVRVATLSSSSKTTNDPPAPRSPSILGTPTLSASELASWYTSTGHQANATAPIAQLASDYAKWGKTFGVRDDLAFAQSIVETGYFSFPSGGQLTSKDNNFAGIGACDSCAHGLSFPDASTGVEAQVELLYQYATKAALPSGAVNVVGGTSLSGCCTTWVELAGRWATSRLYGKSIMTVYENMLNWVIPLREQQAGIAIPAPPA